jgi:hypothetical protein
VLHHHHRFILQTVGENDFHQQLVMRTSGENGEFITIDSCHLLAVLLMIMKKHISVELRGEIPETDNAK